MRALIRSILCLSLLSAVVALEDAKTIDLDISGLTAGDAIWEPGDRLLVLGPDLWSSRFGNWRMMLPPALAKGPEAVRGSS